MRRGVELAAADSARRVSRNPRLDSEVVSLADIAESRQRAGQTGAIQVVDARHRRPVIDLVLAADAAAEIRAPDAPFAALEAQRLERNPHFRGPAVGIHLRRHGPHGIPARVDVAPFVGNLRVGLRAGRVGGKDEAVAAIRERVEQQFERILFAGREVLADVVDDQRRGHRVVAADADVQRVAVEQEAHRRALGRGLPFVRLGLNEVGGGLRGDPRLVVEDAVERDRRPRLDGRDDARIRGGGRPSRERTQRGTQDKPRPAAEARTTQDLSGKWHVRGARS